MNRVSDIILFLKVVQNSGNSPVVILSFYDNELNDPVVTESIPFSNIIAALRNQIKLDALAVVRPTGVYLLDFFCSGIQFYVFSISPPVK